MESPCRDICVLDAAQTYCIGCGRTLDQIGRWAEMNDTERARIMAALVLPSHEDQQFAPDHAAPQPHLRVSNAGDSA